MDLLRNFLRTKLRKATDNVITKPKTHTKKLKPSACYSIPSQDSEEFMRLYCSAAARKNIILGITELVLPNKLTPLRVDFDFRLDQSKYSISKSPITLNLIKEIIRFYQIAIEDVCDSDEDVTLAQTCILLEKEGGFRIENGVMKEGFHLHFPHMIASAYTQDVIIRRQVIESLAETDLLGDLEWDPLHLKSCKGSPLETLVDKIATKAWLMYNSRKDRDSKPWLIKQCFDAGLQTMEMEDVFDCEMEGYNESILYHLPRLLSIRTNKTETRLKPRYCQRSLNRLKDNRKAQPQRLNPEKVAENLKLIQEAGLLDMLSDRRAQEYNLWMDVGWALFCIGDGSEKALDMWIEFSKKCPEKFNEDVCVKEWTGMIHKGKTMWSLMKIAQEDSPDEYRQWRESEEEGIIEIILKAPRVTDYAVGKLMWKMYEGQFICSGHKSDEWYEFHTHRWHELDGAVSMRTKLLEEVAGKFRNKLAALLQDQGDDDGTKNTRRKLWNVVERIENMAGQDSILRMAKTIFYDPKFDEKKDQADYLFVFENGVYDLDAGLFRNGRPDDYMTLSCQHYFRNFDRHDVEIEEVEVFWKKIFPNPNLYNYFMNLAASNMKAGNRHKLCPIFTGNHDGGKSVTVEFICRAFGEYAYVFPREFMMLKAHTASSGGPRADIYQSKGKRWAFCPELAENEELNVGLLKATTGSDSTWCRTLNQRKGERVKPKYCLTFQCNTPPKIPSSDDAAFRRIRLLDFEAQFFEDLKKVPRTWIKQLEKKRFPADTDIKSNGKLDEMCEPWLWLLIQRFREYKCKGGKLETPHEVEASTSEYKADNDIYVQFVNENLAKSVETDKVTLTLVFAEFTAWYNENYPDYCHRNKIGKIQFRKNLVNHLGKFLRKGTTVWWNGWKMNGEEDIKEI